MKADILEIARYLKDKSPKELLKKAIENGATEAELVQMNTDQLARFEDSEGKKLADIGGEYSVTTQVIKGLGPREVNLNDEGDFWESLEANATDKGFTMDGDTIKEGVDLRDRWGDNIEGIQDEKKAERIIEKRVWNQVQESL